VVEAINVPAVIEKSSDDFSLARRSNCADIATPPEVFTSESQLAVCDIAWLTNSPGLKTNRCDYMNIFVVFHGSFFAIRLSINTLWRQDEDDPHRHFPFYCYLIISGQFPLFRAGPA
jgi:hypothetical protein